MRSTHFGSIVAAVVVAAFAQACSSGGSTGEPTPVLQKAAAASGDGQTAMEGTALANPLKVEVTSGGSPRAGETVTWSATAGDGAVSPTTSVTDASGIATTTWTLGNAAGAETVKATLAGASGSPQTFTATAVAGPVPVIAMAPTASGNAQSGTVAAQLVDSLRVLVTLQGVPQAGVAVSWAAAGTGASVAPVSSMTGADGIASTTWTLSHTSGNQSATATLAGASGSPVTFTAVAAPAAPATIALVGGDNQTGSPGSTLPAPLTVAVADLYANPVSGVVVAWQVSGGTGTVSPTSGSTGANGQAQTSLTLGATQGAVTVTATHLGLTGSPVTFHETAATGALAASVLVGDIFFKSVHNNTSNPAVDTIAVGGRVTWTWGGVASHSVESTGSPSFTSSVIQTSGTYSFTFNTAGTYTYDCAVHGAGMTGIIVVR